LLLLLLLLLLFLSLLLMFRRRPYSSFSGAYLTLRTDLRAHAVMDREERRIRSGESAFVDGLETHNLEAFDRSLSPATRAAAKPKPNENTSKWCGKRALKPRNGY